MRIYADGQPHHGELGPDRPARFRNNSGQPFVRNCCHVSAPFPSFLTPRATIRSAPSGSGRCRTFASSHGALIQTSTSSGVVWITGIAFGWITSTSAFGSVVREA